MWDGISSVVRLIMDLLRRFQAGEAFTLDPAGEEPLAGKRVRREARRRAPTSA